MAPVPFDQREGFIWSDAKIHVLSHGLHYASAVFEGERTYGGEIFKLNEHTERLHELARILGFQIPYTVEELNSASRKLLAMQGFADAYVRPIAWRGSESMGVGASQQDQRRHRHLAMAEFFRSGTETERHTPRFRRVSPARPEDGAVEIQGRRPLHDVHDLQARGRGQGLR